MLTYRRGGERSPLDAGRCSWTTFEVNIVLFLISFQAYFSVRALQSAKKASIPAAVSGWLNNCLITL
jgi:hypothetical protein